MPEHKVPGVYLEEASFRATSIEGVPSGTAGFAGLTRSGPARGRPRPVTSFTEFERVYGGLELLTVGKQPRLPYVAHAARAFFLNGGQRLYVARIDVRMRIADFARALAVLAGIEEVEVVALPDSGDLGGEAASRKAARELVAHVERQRHRIAVLDPPVGSSTAQVRAFRAQFDSSRAALYYPWVAVADPSGTALRSKARQRLLLPPCGFVSGVYARGDVAKGPAGEIVGAIGFERTIAKAEADVLNPDAINVLRTVAGRGQRVVGTRTLSSDAEWKYVSVRRLLSFLERSIEQGTEWVAFEPNNERLWGHVRRTIDDFLLAQWRTGMLLGTKPEAAYFVRCDRTTMTQDDLDNGRLVCLVGVAVLRPAEFVVFRIGRWTADVKN